MKIYQAVAFAAVAALSSVANAEDSRPLMYRVELHSGWDEVKLGGQSDSGVAFGGAFGIDVALSPTIFAGIEGDIDGSSVKACANSVLFVGDRACIKSGRDLAAVARIGTTAGRARLYALGGYANARVKATYSLLGASSSASDNLNGWRLGAGVEEPLGQNIYVKGEYRYTNYEGDARRNQLIIGLGYKF